jgi:hypothetical protein
LHCPSLFSYSAEHEKINAVCNSIFLCTNNRNWWIKGKGNANVDSIRGENSPEQKYESRFLCSGHWDHFLGQYLGCVKRMKMNLNIGLSKQNQEGKVAV